MASYVALQPHYNLMERDRYEGELAALCERSGLACVPFFALARGFLSGKYRRDGEQVDSPRAAGVHDSYFNERGFAVLDALDEIAGERHAAVAAVALAWLAAQPTVVAPIASATSTEQGRAAGSVELELSGRRSSRASTRPRAEQGAQLLEACFLTSRRGPSGSSRPDTRPGSSFADRRLLPHDSILRRERKCVPQLGERVGIAELELDQA